MSTDRNVMARTPSLAMGRAPSGGGGIQSAKPMPPRFRRLAGETEQRLYLLQVWREAPIYTARERAALAWAEAVTLVAQSEVSDEVYAEVREQFDERALVELNLAIIAINGWNRMAIAFRARVGDYVVAGKSK